MAGMGGPAASQETRFWAAPKLPTTSAGPGPGNYPRHPTPNLPLRGRDWDQVYEPAEDTFLLLDALNADWAALRAAAPALALEVGAGSGCVSAFLSGLLPPGSLFSLATDVNGAACVASRATAAANPPARLDVVRTDLVAGLLPRLAAAVDVLVFNPPYVVTPPADVGRRDISAAWAGGLRGRAVLDRLLPAVGDLLSPQGVFYLVALAENDPADIAASLKASAGLHCATVLQRKAGNERLSILRFTRGT